MFLCFSHHDAFESTSNQFKALTVGEVKHYRELLHAWFRHYVETRDVALLLEVDAEFTSFDADAEKDFLHSLSQICEVEAIKVRRRQSGSVQLTVSLSRESAERVVQHFSEGKLEALKVTGAEITNDEVASDSIKTKRNRNSFDVFLCHNSREKPYVLRIAQELRDRGLLPWVDTWELQPGVPWQPELERQIENINAAAVFIGESGVGPWQEVELDAFLREFVRRRCPVIPVILPGSERLPRLPLFLRGMTWVDLRNGRRESMDRLIWGITGKKTI